MDAAFFTRNRARLREQLQKDSFVAFAGFGAMQKDVDQPFPFQQDANFWYLTGVEEPDWQVILDTDSGEEWLVAPSLNSYQLVFDGGLSHAQAATRSGIAKVISRQQAKPIMSRLLAAKKSVYTIVPKARRVYGFQQNQAQRRFMAQLKGPERLDMSLIMARLRAVKSQAEINAIQAAVDITVQGITATLKEVGQYSHEHEVDAKLYYEFRRRGATHGFEPIVASGKKTCILHAPPATDPLHDWLLLDVGARIHGYTADITRTIPLRPPTDRQVAIYQAVQRMHDHFLTLLKPGASTTQVLMKEAYPFVAQELVGLGLIKKPLLNAKNTFKFMPHGITHGLGIDVHDPLGQPEFFLEGMVLTDEVGVYIPEEGFGVRIENDIVITADGARNMSANLPISLGELTKMVY